MRTPIVLLLCTFACYATGQISRFPYSEHFDSVMVPALPSGWLTTTSRSLTGDFTTTHSVPLSDSNAILSTNATVEQALISPILDFTDREADSLIFYERRSSSHNSGLLVEASKDGGSTFPIEAGDTLKNPGVTSYVRRALMLPTALSHQPSVRLRWRVIGNGSGTTGTIRFDDILVTARSAFDAELRSIAIRPAVPRGGDSILASAIVRNSGTSPLARFFVDFYLDINGDSTAEPEERFAIGSADRSLEPNDSLTVDSRLYGISAGNTSIIAVVRSSGDQNPQNDTLRRGLTIAYGPSSIVINEIMYDPLSGGSEYVELFNTTAAPVDLDGWSITDVPSARTGTHIISRKPLVIGPREYAVIANDSSIFNRFGYLREYPYRVAIRPSSFSLNNSGDDIMVSDLTESTVDSVHYLPEWNNQEIDDPSGRSLERINPALGSNNRRNWSTSADALGGTPGKQNSLYTVSTPTGAAASFAPNPFSPDGDGHEDVTILTYRISAFSAIIRVRIYDSRGRLIRTLADGDPSGSRGELIWDGTDDERRRVRIGIYIALLEASGAAGELIEGVKCVVVVAAKL